MMLSRVLRYPPHHLLVLLPGEFQRPIGLFSGPEEHRFEQLPGERQPGVGRIPVLGGFGCPHIEQRMDRPDHQRPQPVGQAHRPLPHNPPDHRIVGKVPRIHGHLSLPVQLTAEHCDAHPHIWQ